MQNNSPYDLKMSIKRGCIYLLIALPFMLVVATLLTIINAPYWLVLLATVVVGGGAVLVCIIVNTKIAEKRKQKMQNENTYDPFSD